jgi:hypothetical protein
MGQVTKKMMKIRKRRERKKRERKKRERKNDKI